MVPPAAGVGGVGRRVTGAPLVRIVRDWLGPRPAHPRVVGVHGSQGAGKTTLCAALRDSLGALGWGVVVLSIDDVYLEPEARRELARRVHPLLETRGVPGTHDVALARQTLARLRSVGPGETVSVPRFDKATGRRGEPEEVSGPVHLVLFEGWCVGLPPVPAERLAVPFNELERECDPDGTWRHYVAEQLAGPYAALWSELDGLVALLAPDLQTVVDWRTEAEAPRIAAGAPGAIRDVPRFVQHYARWTAWGLEVLPERADLSVHLAPDRSVRDYCTRLY